MHELSIVLSVVAIAEKEALAAGRKVQSIRLDIGELSGVELASLEFAWEMGVKNSVLEGAVREINHITGRAVCADCSCAFDKHHRWDACPLCGGYLHAVTQGEELHVRSITLI
jgi:hydrogenase nickel incorporation protein HypA/HybF